MDFQNNLVMIAGCIAFNSGMCLVRFPGGLVNIGKRDGDWVFLHANLIALCISMAVFIVGMTVGPTLWKKIKKLARRAMGIAFFAMGIAVCHIIFMVVGNDYWLRLFVNGSAIFFMVFTSISIYILNSRYAIGGR